MYGRRRATVVGQYTEIDHYPNCGMNEQNNWKHEIYDYCERQEDNLEVLSRLFCLLLVNND
jgi:hypothetical protein